MKLTGATTIEQWLFSRLVETVDIHYEHDKQLQRPQEVLSLNRTLINLYHKLVCRVLKCCPRQMRQLWSSEVSQPARERWTGSITQRPF